MEYFNGIFGDCQVSNIKKKYWIEICCNPPTGNLSEKWDEVLAKLSNIEWKYLEQIL